MIILMWVLTGIAIAIPAVFFGRGKLQLQRDFFFLFVYAQFLAYLHIAPTYRAPDLPGNILPTYFWLECASILFFEIPCLWLYLRAMRKYTLEEQNRSIGWQVIPDRHLIFVGGSMLLCLLYWYVIVRNELVFSRFLTEAPAIMGSLPRWQYYVIRLFLHAGMLA